MTIPAETVPMRLVHSVDEAAEQLNVGRTLIYNLIGLGELGSVKIGGRRLITHRQLDTFVRALEERCAAQPLKEIA